MTRIAVIGGGISGLAAAYQLASAGVEVCVYDRADRAGGKLRTTPFEGLPIEEGADAFLVRLPEATNLAHSVGAPVIHPETGAAQVFSGGRLRTLPPGTVLGVPGSLRGLSEVVGTRGVARAALDLVLPTTPPAGRLAEDDSVGELVRRRLGRAVLDRMVDPLLGGVYAGSATGLSVRATAPALVDPGRSLLRTVSARRPATTGGGPVFGSVPGGTGALVEAVTTAILALGSTIETGCTVTGLRQEGGQWAVRVGPAGDDNEERYDGVVVAVPASPAARLLEGHLPTRSLPATAYASVAIVALAYRPGTTVPSGNGFLVAESERRSVKAVTFVGHKWRHPQSAPVVIRASIGRYGGESDLQRPDVELAGVAAADVASLAGIPGRPVASRVTRWGGALPQYRPGHLDRVAELRAALPAAVAVCGAAYDGVGIPACVRSGSAAARAVLATLGG